ncbi:MAG: hypothetical protein QM786_12675 [Breznakibacter sp.]
MKMDEAKRYKLVIGVLILVNVLIIGVWWIFYINDYSNDSGERRGGEWRNQRRDAIEQTLQLDSLQKVRFRQLSDAHMKMLGRLNREIDSLKFVINREIMVQDGSTQQIDNLFRIIAEKRAAVDTSIFYHFKRLRGVCHPGQVVKFDSLMMEYMSRKDRGPKRFNQEQRGVPHGERQQDPPRDVSEEGQSVD